MPLRRTLSHVIAGVLLTLCMPLVGMPAMQADHGGAYPTQQASSVGDR